MSLRRRTLPFLALLLGCLLGSVARGASDFGVNGLIDMPDARMSDDGMLLTTYARQDLVDIYSLGYQATPWLQGTFRYSIFNPRRVSGSTDALNDRSFELKARLLEERRFLPQVAVGARDLLGTGVWGGEYLVASKEVGPLDLTLGLGWGRLAERRIADNPLIELNDSFGDREEFTGKGGEFTFSNYFSGEDVGLFGGARLRLPWLGASLLAEYSSDALEREERLGSIDDPSPWSFGLELEPVADVQVGVSWQHGDQLGLRVSSQVPTMIIPDRKAPNDFELASRRGGELKRIGLRGRSWYLRMVSAAEASGLLIRSADFVDAETLNIVYTNRDYQLEADAIRRVLLLAEAFVPKEVRVVVLTGQEGAYATHSARYLLARRSRWAQEAPAAGIDRTPTLQPALRRSDPEFQTPFRYPNVGVYADLGLRAYIFDPDDPFLFQLFARLSVEADLGRGFGVTGSWVQNLYNQFGDIVRESDSVLPRVRTDLASYLREGETGIDRIVLTHSATLGRDLYYKSFAGILEEMYAGVGAEMLYRPFGSPFAVGVNLIGVRQRDFDRGLGLRDYRTLIGHLSGYWTSPFYNVDVAVHAGRFLAKDWGATIEMQRRFANGWSVGAFATFTDVPFDEFGEGSFDKGLVLRIPFNSFSGRNTRGAYRTIIRSIQRDGGQRLDGWGTTLWETLRENNHDRLEAFRDRMLP